MDARELHQAELEGVRKRDREKREVDFLIVRNRKLASIASSAYAAARRLGVRFTVRQIGKDVEVHYVGKAPKDS
jgi:hypothetical protein